MNDGSRWVDGAIARNTGDGKFQASIRTAGIEILADEPLSVGGNGSGPSPYQMLAAALAACTTMTVKLYAERKGWPVTHVETSVEHSRQNDLDPADCFTRRIEIEGEIDTLQKARLMEIADHCPVHRTLTGGARVETLSADAPSRPMSASDHAVDMEALISVGRGSFDFTE
ncbi:OsmC family protein [Sphingomonas abietis]|uniref:OsmC family protein n=1 Tax=Sphingomonas abietis TaxID=3012344 RepID=A0ABY7NKF6_9SPHN|nr:OsmC family protein [Sphingomonas abietis]WBO21828.1 OsmC family protein [Sphingomonas abietis]